MNGKGRAIANRNWKFNYVRNKKKQICREIYGKNLFEFFSDEDLEKISIKNRIMLENNTATLKKCLKCARVLLVFKRKLMKFQRFFIAKYGGYVCKPCHFGSELPAEEDRSAQKVFKKVYNNWEKNRDKSMGIKTYKINESI